MYTFDGRVRYSEIDHRGTMTLPSLINYFQDCSTFQSEDIGCGLQALGERHRAWLLSYWQIEIRRYPELGEKITVGTFACGFDKFFGYRNFVMLDGAKTWVARAYSVWIYLDIKTGHPARLCPEDIAPYGQEPPLDMVLEKRKILLPQEGESMPAFPVRREHIDTNEHVNNCQYVQMAQEVLPKDLEVRKLRVEYRKAAVLGDMIYPQVANEEGRTVVVLCDGEEKPYAVVEFK
ncbi:MAG: acyl-[acyl-carrier-protein] thioesterase [Hespellia sp.]|jgi:medium-chain acyl-[acyl-carrier-protein] hydrolase|nr:acyl-[acyl-carrier-protein] thioesterase [Hespellia sp.]